MEDRRAISRKIFRFTLDRSSTSSHHTTAIDYICRVVLYSNALFQAGVVAVVTSSKLHASALIQPSDCLSPPSSTDGAEKSESSFCGRFKLANLVCYRSTRGKAAAARR
eukprot:scaffold14081_cov138-Skeletonema_menzelii.AAC.9